MEILREMLVCDAVDPNMPFVVPMASAVVECRGGMLTFGIDVLRLIDLPNLYVGQGCNAKCPCVEACSQVHHRFDPTVSGLGDLAVDVAFPGHDAAPETWDILL